VFVRVVRWTPDRIAELRGSVEDSGIPPEGVPTSGLQVVHDESQGTAVVIQLFDTADDMRTGAEVLGAMDPADTPGTRASVDAGEVVVDVRASS
jgi:hypothetical protein